MFPMLGSYTESRGELRELQKQIQKERESEKPDHT